MSRLDAHEASMGLIEQRKDITLNEMMARLTTERAVIIGHSVLISWQSSLDGLIASIKL